MPADTEPAETTITLRCPFCQGELAAYSCNDCEVFWVGRDHDPLDPLPDIAPTPEVDLVLKHSLVLPLLGCQLFLGILGLSAAIASAWALLYKPSTLDWLAALVGIPMGGFIGAFMTSWLLQMAIQAVRPSRITGTGEQLRLLVWQNWRSFWNTWQRSELVLLREQVRGVGLSKWQGESWGLNIVHSSGHAFWVGWSGDRKEAEAHARALQAWFAADASPDG